MRIWQEIYYKQSGWEIEGFKPLPAKLLRKALIDYLRQDTQFVNNKLNKQAIKTSKEILTIKDCYAKNDNLIIGLKIHGNHYKLTFQFIPTNKGMQLKLTESLPIQIDYKHINTICDLLNKYIVRKDAHNQAMLKIYHGNKPNHETEYPLLNTIYLERDKILLVYPTKF